MKPANYESFLAWMHLLPSAVMDKKVQNVIWFDINKKKTFWQCGTAKRVWCKCFGDTNFCHVP